MDSMIIRTKPTPKKATVKAQSKSNFTIVRIFMDKFYRDPYRWGLLKCVAFFAAGVYTAKMLSDLDILPTDTSAASSAASVTQSAY